MTRVSVTDAAQIIGVKPATIRGWIHRGAVKRGPDGKLELREVMAAEKGRSLAALCTRAGMRRPDARHAESA